MGQSEESSSPIRGLFGTTLILAAGGLIAYFTFDPTLESRRPNIPDRALPPPPFKQGLPAVHARLWDDPLHSAYHDSLRRSRSTAQNEWGSPHSEETPDDEIPDGEGPVRNLPALQRYLATIVADSVADQPNRFVCLPILVPGEPYDGDTELRRRKTYAVIAALTASGYALSIPDRVSYVHLPVAVTVPAVKEERFTNFVVPVKLFKRTEVGRKTAGENHPNGVLVLWVNENQLGQRPLWAIAQILETLFRKAHVKHRSNIDVGIIGPTDGSTLLAMAQEDAVWGDAEHWKVLKSPRPKIAEHADKLAHPACFTEEYPQGVVLYSDHSTISAQSLAGSNQSQFTDFTSGKQTKSGLTVVRTIGSNWELIERLAHELSLRGAWPLSLTDRSRLPNPGRIVLLTEADSIFGRGFPAAMANAYPELLSKKGGEISDATKLLHVFTYLRGLDGKTPIEKSTDPEEPPQPAEVKAEKKESDTVESQNLETIPASGKSQYDYLKRLEERLVELDGECQSRGEEGITAIGVVGTDVYDKLLVLRALRKSFPRTWFFSTDVDASFSLPAEYPTTRNLIVASHFGLELHPDLQRMIPPFRDVYQTSTYFSTLLALGDQQVVDAFQKPYDPWNLQSKTGAGDTPAPDGLRPLVFEMGRSGPYQLTIPERESAASRKLHPPGQRNPHWLMGSKGMLAVLVMGSLALACCWVLSKSTRRTLEYFCHGWKRDDLWSGRGLLRITVAILVALAIALLRSAATDHSAPDGEPFVLLEGISIWGPTIIRYLGLVLGIAFIYKVAYELRNRLGKKVTECFEFQGAASSSCGKSLHTFIAHGSRKSIFVWSLIGTIGFLIFSRLLLELTEFPPAPFRGPTAEAWQKWVMRLAFPPLVFLSCLVIAYLEYCRRFVTELARRAADWSVAEMHELHTARKPIVLQDLGELLTVRIIVEATTAAGNLVKFPFIVLFIVIASRHPALDKLEIPWSLVAIWGITVGILSWSAHAMRRDTFRARDAVLERLRDALSAARNHDAGESPAVVSRRIAQLEQYMTEIRRESGGGFRPVMRDPIVHALALGASGGLMLIHQLLPYL